MVFCRQSSIGGFQGYQTLPPVASPPLPVVHVPFSSLQRLTTGVGPGKLISQHPKSCSEHQISPLASSSVDFFCQFSCCDLFSLFALSQLFSLRSHTLLEPLSLEVSLSPCSSLYSFSCPYLNLGSPVPWTESCQAVPPQRNSGFTPSCLGLS